MSIGYLADPTTFTFPDDQEDRTRGDFPHEDEEELLNAELLAPECE